MSSGKFPNPNMLVELPGSPVPWWSKPITLGVHLPVAAIRLGIIAHRGWNRKVRLSLIQDGHTHPPVTYRMPQSTMQVLLNEIGAFNIHSDFSPCVSLEFEFGEGPEDEPGRPWVVIHTKTPIFLVPPVVPPRAPPWIPIIHDPRQGYLLSRRNELQVMVHESRIHLERRDDAQ